MISEHQFSNHYLSVWRVITPLADGYWALENLLVDRIDTPLVSKAPKEMRALINETAFRAFCVLKEKEKNKDKGRKKAEVKAAIAGQVLESINYIRRFSASPLIMPEHFDKTCYEETAALVLRLSTTFNAVENTSLRPRFHGCGILSACEGDVIEGSCLYEIKAGERGFRISDLRQLLTYSALAYAKGRLTFSDIGLYNPRTGVIWKKSLEDVSRALSGLRLNDTLSALVEQFSGASTSR